MLRIRQCSRDHRTSPARDYARQEWKHLESGEARQFPLGLHFHVEEWYKQYDQYAQGCVEDPHCPCKVCDPVAPSGRTDINDHEDNLGEAHGPGRKKEGLCGMIDHDPPLCWVQGEAQYCGERERREQEKVKTEYHDRQPREPLGRVWEGVEQDGYSACAHC